ncbi:MULTISPECIES: dipeptide ABC transporter ATP-binding protein [unclassified Rhizobium]|uniref:dipeptide ABC transporter ATP-binding protein n=1 Tax=unclassified Rhizobium TaxID=2613769 RepID=UPI001ADCB0CA|nr:MULTISPECIES: ABC transporter ATP-binding protein [unclassified Rhizobium]MBO9101031.1 ABC transporter ATP-binding protein [Rhizobium sp. L58/93]MBO9186620.1 ABC transporter ATP-binding protein [Rhizobium sp. E27B/91]QXZ86003.1 ABC transporter ATP-binding protein [Rhizobium sp. K1/93]QXZ92539.1 ABC transporter ATP-binding protein [Rhizobium sp. K15/93]QYA04244.1 ABC transporter ATP-binding protein [Rhizobium sp. B21/90]
MAPQDRLAAALSRADTSPLTLKRPTPLLQADGLSVSYGQKEVVSSVGFELGRGKSLALIGESGSGKSTIARAVLRLLPNGGRASGRIAFEGQEILGLPERRFRPLRGRAIGFVPQDPGNSLNPVRTIGVQAMEAAALLDEPDKAIRKALVLDTFAQVGLDNPQRVFDSYPHQLSGGMLQRVLIGLAVLPRPALLIADEPTSALDVTIQKKILDLLSRLQRELDMSLLLITHDLAIAAERTDALVVLKDGVVQEAGSTTAVFSSPTSAYTKKLHADVPVLNPNRYAALRDPGFRMLKAVGGKSSKIEVSAVTKNFTVGNKVVTAVDKVSFSVPAGTTHALVGESGSGKTTTIRLLLGLEQPDIGQIWVSGEELTGRSQASLRSVWRHLQIVYQNPFTSLDPSWKVEELVREPLDRFKIGTRKEQVERVREALKDVGLAEDFLSRKPGALSGGQRQRVAIARALVLKPDVIVLDEPTSALDVSVQAGIVEVLLSLQAKLGLTYVFVSHDLALVRQLAHTVSVMQRGRIVEHGTVADIFDNPQQPYTVSLLEAIPSGAANIAPVPHVEPRRAFQKENIA